jgi:hypothetical protein
MITLRTIALLFSFSLSLSIAALAQKDDPAKRSAQLPAAVSSVTVSLTTKGVRFSVPGAIGQLRLEVFDQSGVSLYNSDFRPVTVFDWPLQNRERQAVADGIYLCVVTLRGVAGKLSVKQGTVVVQNGQAALQLEEAQIGAVESERSLTPVSDSSASPATMTMQDDQNGQVVTTGNALTFRIGNFFAGLDRERMRITQEGRVGIGTADPKATLDVRGIIRASQGIEFADGTVLRTAANGKGVAVLPGDGGKGGGSFKPYAAGTGTANRLTKWAETGGAGTLGDSAFSDVAGTLGIGTTTPDTVYKLDVRGHVVLGTTRKISLITDFPGSGELAPGGFFGSLGQNSLNFAASTDIGNAGSRVKLVYYNGTEWLSALEYANVSGGGLATMTLMKNGGGVGIGTSTPQAKLDVAGDLRVSGAGSGIIFPDGTRMNTAGGTGSVTGSGATGALPLWTGSAALGNSAITQTGNNVSVANNFTAAGTISGGNVIAKYQDVAEWVPGRGALPAGTLVTLDSRRNNSVVPSGKAYDTHVAGVVSAQPGLILGEGGEGQVLVATTGRVKVRVDAGRGAIRIGDLLVTSGREGVAMKSRPVRAGRVLMHRPGTIVGKALEPLKSGTGEILVLLSLQ